MPPRKPPPTLAEAVESALKEADKRIPGTSSGAFAALARQFATIATSAEYERDRLAAGKAVMEILSALAPAKDAAKAPVDRLDELNTRRQAKRVKSA